MNYDRILQYIGEFGTYQKRACLLLCIIGIPVGLHSTSVVFQNNKPKFRCAVPGLLNDTYNIQDEAHQQLVNLFIPVNHQSGQYSECKSYAFLNDSESLLPNRNKTLMCERWVYDQQDFGSSVATEFNFVCHREINKAHVNMMLMLGILFGSFFGGSIADFFGRKKVIIISLMLQVCAGVALAFSWSITAIIAFRFTIAFTGVTCFLCAFVLSAEIVGPSYRTMVTMSLMFGWCAGLFVLLLVQYFFRDWHVSQLVQTVPFGLFVLSWWILPESPRWLLNRGRLREATEIITKMAAVNKVKLPQEMEPVTSLSFGNGEGFEEQSMGQKENSNLFHMLSRPILAVRLIVLAVCWSTLSMVYYGLVLGVGDLIDGDIFINFFVQSMMEVISNAVGLALMGRVGRKKIFCTAMILAGVACLSISIMIIVQADIHWLSAVLFSLGKFGITLAFSLIFIVTAELLPTVVRNSGLGFCSCLGRIAGVASPYIASASLMIPGSFGKALPVFLFGALSLVSGLLSLLLPETRNRKLPDTIDEANNFKKLTPRQKHAQDDNGTIM